jgi:ATP-dependent helicase HrpA
VKARAAALRAKIKPSEKPLTRQLTELLKSDYQIQTYPDQWEPSKIPERLQARILVENHAGHALAESRNLDQIKKKLQTKAETVRKQAGLETVPAWQAASAKIEQQNLSGWTFGDLPKRIDLSEKSTVPLSAYPALIIEAGQVHLRLLPDFDEARHATREAWPLLCEQAMGREAAWLQRDLRDLKKLGAALLPLGGYEQTKNQGWAQLRRHLFDCPNPLPLRESLFQATLDGAERERPGLVTRLCERLHTLLEARSEVALLLEQKKTSRAIRYPGMKAQLEAVAPPDLLLQYEFKDLPHLTRFLKAMVHRARRARENVQKDIEKAKRIEPYELRLTSLSALAARKDNRAAIKPYRLLLEEFKVSVFAQELGTGQKVSEKRLDRLAATIESELR